jgi:putative inorganic carbon (HCO3(-)) transporter
VATAVATPVKTQRSSRTKPLSWAYGSLLLFMVVYCARPEDWVPGLAVIPIAKVTGILALCAFFLSVGGVPLRFPKEVRYLLLLVGLLFLTVPFSPVWRGGAFQGALNFAKLVPIVLAITFVVNTVPRLRRIIFVQAVSVTAIAIAAVKAHVFLGQRLEGALEGNYGNPNDLAIAIALSFPFCFAFLLRARSRIRKLLWISAMAVMTYTVLLTASRGGFFALIVAAGACLWEFGVKGRRIYLIFLVGIVGLLLFSFAGGQITRRISATFGVSGSDFEDQAAYESAQARRELLKKSIEVTAEHPLLGIGPGNFEVVSGSWHGTHNSYTQMSSEAGLVGLILYILILLSALANVCDANFMILWCEHRPLAPLRWNRGRSELFLLSGAIRASIFAYLVGSLFASEAYQYFPYFLVAYSTALVRIARLEFVSVTQAAESRRELRSLGEIDGRQTELA